MRQRDDNSTEAAGTTAIVVLFADVTDRIHRWHVHTREPGLPAHVSLMFPFKQLDDISEGDLDRLRSLFEAEPTGPVTFARTARFPGVVYLEPEDDGRFRRLTEELTELFPDHPPYGGAFDEVIPHLTVTFSAVEEELDLVERELAPHLPLETRVDEAWLMHFDGEEWSTEMRFAFREAL